MTSTTYPLTGSLKRMLLLLTLLPIAHNLLAEKVPIEKAKEVAISFIQKNTKTDITSISIDTFQHNGNMVYTYVASLYPEGWVMLAADDRIPAILAYSTIGNFDSKKVHSLPFYFWFKDYEVQIAKALDMKLGVHPSWNSNFTQMGIKNAKEVEPLIKTKWNQNSPWNMYCPADSEGPGGHTLAGCVAVATSQCMMVHKHPEHGYKSHSYTHNVYGSQSANFAETTYQWDSMSNTLPSEHIALLLRHVGVAVDMNYSADFSGAYSSKVPYALKTYFDYSNSTKLVSRNSYSDEDWTKLITSELEAGRPVYYAGDGNDGEGGHAFNLDGVNANGYFHFNWGWSGQCDGYYLLNNLVPYSGANFSFNHEAIVGMMPRNHNPYNITLSKTSVKERLAIGSYVCSITVFDETPDDEHQLSIVGLTSQPGATPFEVPFAIKGKNLVTTDTLWYNETQSYPIQVTATDLEGHTFSKFFTIAVIENPIQGVNNALNSNNITAYHTKNGIKYTINNNINGEINISIYSTSGNLIKTARINKQSQIAEGTITLDDTTPRIVLMDFRMNNQRAVKKVAILP